MQYLLSEEEYRALTERTENLAQKNRARIIYACTLVADHAPLHTGKVNGYALCKKATRRKDSITAFARAAGSTVPRTVTDAENLSTPKTTARKMETMQADQKFGKDKPIEDHFADWESHVFGFGYGSGERHVLEALKTFMDCVGKNHRSSVVSDMSARGYHYLVLEESLTPTVAWLLINALCHHDSLEYGSSPRFAWLTEEGEALKAFIDRHTVEELYALCGRDQDYIGCFPDYCNCGDLGPCRNPFWRSRELRSRHPKR